MEHAWYGTRHNDSRVHSQQQLAYIPVARSPPTNQSSPARLLKNLISGQKGRAGRSSSFIICDLREYQYTGQCECASAGSGVSVGWGVVVTSRAKVGLERRQLAAVGVDSWGGECNVYDWIGRAVANQFVGYSLGFFFSSYENLLAGLCYCFVCRFEREHKQFLEKQNRLAQVRVKIICFKGSVWNTTKDLHAHRLV